MKRTDKIQGGIWGAVTGDAMGVPVEFTSRENCRDFPVTTMRGFGTHSQPVGTWSDDSSLLLCTVEALSEPEYDAAKLAGLFLNWRQYGYMTPHGNVFDIGIATTKALTRYENGTPPEESGGNGERDNGNGSLMRILPAAIRYAGAPIEEMLFMAHRISAITHRHIRSQMACGLYCLMAKALLTGMTPPKAYRYMIEQGQQYYNAAPFNTKMPAYARVFSGSLPALPESEIKSSGYVIDTLEASLWCLLNSKTFEETVLKAVNLGDDTDTTGCVAGGLAGIYYGINAIPRQWTNTIACGEDIAKLIDKFTAAIKK